MAIDEGDLRKALKKVFDKFDYDGSGSVSIDELNAMVDQLKMDIPPAKRKQMLEDADPDGSGEIDFEEFVTFIHYEMDKGATGGLADVVKEAAGFFGFLGGFFSFFSGFGGSSEPAAAPAVAPSPAAASARNSARTSARSAVAASQASSGLFGFFGGESTAIVSSGSPSSRSPKKHKIYSLKMERREQESHRRKIQEVEFQKRQKDHHEKEAQMKQAEKSARAAVVKEMEEFVHEPGHGPSRWCWPTAGYHPRNYVPGGDILLLPGEFTPAASGPGATLALPLTSPASKYKLENSPTKKQTVELLESPKVLLLMQKQR